MHVKIVGVAGVFGKWKQRIGPPGYTIYSGSKNYIIRNFKCKMCKEEYKKGMLHTA